MGSTPTLQELPENPPISGKNDEENIVGNWEKAKRKVKMFL